jgi:uncharacterized membrane protein HdeD (DUF308 family)
VLRNAVIAIGALFLLGGIAALATGIVPGAVVFTIWGVLLVLGTVFERFRYKPNETTVPPANWERTAERFIDDETGKPVTVYVDPRTGERKYVED